MDSVDELIVSLQQDYEEEATGPVINDNLAKLVTDIVTRNYHRGKT